MSSPQRKIQRRAYSYTRKNGTVVHVPSVLVKDTGMPGKGKSLGVKPKKGALRQYGYYLRDPSAKSRHAALMLAIHDRVPPLSIFRKLMYLATVQKNTNPTYARRAKADAHFVQRA